MNEWTDDELPPLNEWVIAECMMSQYNPQTKSYVFKEVTGCKYFIVNRSEDYISCNTNTCGCCEYDLKVLRWKKI